MGDVLYCKIQWPECAILLLFLLITAECANVDFTTAKCAIIDLASVKCVNADLVSAKCSNVDLAGTRLQMLPQLLPMVQILT